MNFETPAIRPDNVTAVILAGGLGTRLRAVVPDLPKVMALVNGRPFLGHLLDQLHHAGFREVLLCTGHRAETIKAFFGRIYRGMRIIYSHETEPLGTAGALQNALPLICSETFLAMNGDSYINIDLSASLEWFAKISKCEAALLLSYVKDTSRYGAVEFDELGYVTRFLEKSARRRSGWINAGVYLLKKWLLAGISAGRPASLEREILPALIGQGLCAFKGPEEFIDIGTPESFARAAKFFSEMRLGHRKDVNSDA